MPPRTAGVCGSAAKGDLMQDTQLITDSGCDLSRKVLDAAGVATLFFPYTLDGEERFDDFGQTLSYDAFLRCASCRRPFDDLAGTSGGLRCSVPTGV